MKYFMIDIETMGLDVDYDDVIQIGLLELNKGEDGYYWPGKSYSQTLYTSQKPKDKWIEENHKQLLKECEYAPRLDPSLVRQQIKEFIMSCQKDTKAKYEPPTLVGLNLFSLDIPFLEKRGYLKKEDYHYRVYELKGSFNMAEDTLQLDTKLLMKRANDCFTEIKLPANGKKHEAVYDCYLQLKTLNGCIRLLRTNRAS